MLSTSPHGNAVSFSYEAQVWPRQGLPPCWFNTLAIALGPLLRNGLSALPVTEWRAYAAAFAPPSSSRE